MVLPLHADPRPACTYSSSSSSSRGGGSSGSGNQHVSARSTEAPYIYIYICSGACSSSSGNGHVSARPTVVLYIDPQWYHIVNTRHKFYFPFFLTLNFILFIGLAFYCYARSLIVKPKRRKGSQSFHTPARIKTRAYFNSTLILVFFVCIFPIAFLKRHILAVAQNSLKRHSFWLALIQ